MNRQDDNDPVIDESLRQAYRDLSTETPPNDVNARILRMASARPAQRWMQPMALAATVLICVAVVTRVTLESPPVVGPVSAERDIAAVESSPADAVAEHEEEPATKSDSNAPNRRADTVEPKLEQRQRVDTDDMNLAEAHKTLRDAAEPAPEDSAATAFTVENRELLETAERLATVRNGNPSPAAATADSIASFSLAAPACDDEQRETRPDWLECIADLEADGRHEEARDERLHLDLKFPDDD